MTQIDALAISLVAAFIAWIITNTLRDKWLDIKPHAWMDDKGTFHVGSKYGDTFQWSSIAPYSTDYYAEYILLDMMFEDNTKLFNGNFICFHFCGYYDEELDMIMTNEQKEEFYA